MIKVENFETFNLHGAIRGMRFPMQSNHLSDSRPKTDFRNEVYLREKHEWKLLLGTSTSGYTLGKNDLELTKKLIRAGNDHSKFLRQILVSMDITAPLYWWKEMDTYKVATVANSESTMHRLAKTPITKECFSFDDGLDELMDKNGAEQYYVDEYGRYMFFSHIVIEMCEQLRKKFVETGDKSYWRALIQMLPSSWNQTRHWTSNYSTLLNIGHSRENHKLSEWNEFISFLKKNAPYYTEFLEAYNDRKN